MEFEKRNWNQSSLMGMASLAVSARWLLWQRNRDFAATWRHGSMVGESLGHQRTHTWSENCGTNPDLKTSSFRQLWFRHLDPYSLSFGRPFKCFQESNVAFPRPQALRVKAWDLPDIVDGFTKYNIYIYIYNYIYIYILAMTIYI